MVFFRFRQWLNHLSKNKQPSVRAARSFRRERVRLEQLEERLAPALVDWVCNDGDWSNTSCWSSGQLPMGVDDVTINRPGSITVTNALPMTTIRSLQNFETLNLVGTLGIPAVLDLAAASDNQAEATLRLQRATVSGGGILTNRGLLETRSVSQISAGFSNAAGATLRSMGADQFGAATANNLTIDSGFTNSGLIELTSTGGSFTHRLNVPNGVLTNDALGTIATLPGTGGSRNLEATLNNMGTLSLGAGLNLENELRVFESHLGLSINVAAGQTFAVKSGDLGYVTFGASTNLTGGGTLDLTGLTNLVLVTDFTLNPGPILALSGALNVDGPGRFINNSTLQLTNDFFNADVVNNGTLVALGVFNEITGTYSMGTNALLQVLVSRTHGDADIRFTRDITIDNNNNNRIELTSNLADGNATLTLDGATLLNAVGSTIFVGGDLGNRTLAGSATNEGTLDLQRSLTVIATGATYRNVTGRVLFNQTAVELTVFNGNSVFGDPQTLFTGNNSHRLNLAGVHTMSIASTFFFLVANGPRIRLVGRVTVDGPGTLVNQIPLELTGDIINATIDNQSTVTAWGPFNEINGGYGAAPGSGIVIQGRDPCDAEFGPMSCGDADLLIGRDFINNGPIALTSIEGLYFAQLVMPVGTTLTNVGTITAETGPAGFEFGERLMHVQLANRGRVEGNAPAGLTVYGTNALHVNEAAGILDATLMSILFNNGTSLHNLGIIDVGNGQTFALNAMSLVNYNSATHTITDGVFRMNEGTFEFPDADIEVNLADIGMTGPGAALLNNTPAIPLNGLANFRENGRTMLNTGRFLVSNIPNWNILADFTNDGILVVGAASAFNVVAGSLINFGAGTLSGTGVYEVSGGTLRFMGANIVTNAATLNLSGNWRIVNEADVEALDGVITSNDDLGTIILQGGRRLITDSFTNRGLIQINTGGIFQSTIDFIQAANLGILRMNGGQFLADVVFTNQQGARIEGAGTIQCLNLQNAGIVAPGSATAFQLITLKGNYTQTPTGRTRIKVSQAGEFDRFTIDEVVAGDGTGVANLLGFLDVQAVGPDPAAGATFVAIQFISRSGMFGTVSGGYTVTYNATDVTIRKT